MKRPIIGWYCPFTYPPLSNSVGVEIIHLPYEEHNYGRIGGIRLCKKMSCVRNTVFSDALDGIVMSDCCNLSQRIYDIIMDENLELHVYYMRIPRIVDSCFYEILFKEWNKIELWINKHYQYNSDKKHKKKKVLRNNKKEKSDNPALDAVKANNAAWCHLPEELRENVRVVSWKSAADILIKNVYCARLVKGGAINKKERLKGQEYHDLINSIDPECINMCYRNYALSHAQKGNKIDEPSITQDGYCDTNF